MEFNWKYLAVLTVAAIILLIVLVGGSKAQPLSKPVPIGVPANVVVCQSLEAVEAFSNTHQQQGLQAAQQAVGVLILNGECGMTRYPVGANMVELFGIYENLDFGNSLTTMVIVKLESEGSYFYVSAPKDFVDKLLTEELGEEVRN